MTSENDHLDLRVLLDLVRTLRTAELTAWAEVSDCQRRVRERLGEVLEDGISIPEVAAYLRNGGVPIDELQVVRLSVPHPSYGEEAPQWWEVVAAGDARDVRAALEVLTGMRVSDACAPRYRLPLTPAEGRRLRGALPHLRVYRLGDDEG